jgi:hypothetical protein
MGRKLDGRHLAGVSLTVLLAWCATDARADLHFPETAADAGQVYTGKELAHTFVFVNQGREPVEIVAARASCGCLTPRLDKRVYQPGERGELRLEVNTFTQPAGPHAWTVAVRCRSGADSTEVGLRLTAHLVTEVSVQPAALILFTDKPVSHELVLTDVRAQPLTATDVRAGLPGLQASVGEQGRDPLGHAVQKIRLAVTEECPEGRHEDFLQILTDDPGYRDLRVPVTVVKRARQRLAATPGEVTLTAPPGQPAPSRIVLIRDNDDQGVVIDKVEADDPAVTCQWAQGPNKMATVRVRVDRAQIRGNSLHATVQVHVSRPQPDVLLIPVTFMSR